MKGNSALNIYHVAMECSGVKSVGGVGDVVLQLARRCADAGHRTTVVLPRFGQLDPAFETRWSAALRGDGEQDDPTEAVPLDYPGKNDPNHPEERVVFKCIEEPLADREGAGRGALRLLLLDAHRFARREGPYGPYPDVYPANLLLQKAALSWIRRELAAGDGLRPDHTVVHGHDAHAAVLPLLARRGAGYAGSGLERAAFVATAHNCGIAYRQRLWMHKNYAWELAFLCAILEVPEEDVEACITAEGLHRLRGFEPFAAALLYGDYLTHVSEGYFWEIMQGVRSPSTSQLDVDLHGFAAFLREKASAFRARQLPVTNGVDPAAVGPEALPADVRPPAVPTDNFAWKPAFKAGFLGRIARKERALARWPGLVEVQGDLALYEEQQQQAPLFAYVGRLDSQKGLDILVRAVEEVFDVHPAAGLCLLGQCAAVEGEGAHRITHYCAEQPVLHGLVRRYPGRVVFFDGRVESLSQEIFAAADFVLVPSRFEPCGLTDFRAQLNGAVPIVNQVGGLAKVVDNRTGLGFFGLGDRDILRGLVDAMLRALDLHDEPVRLAELQRTADARVRQRHGWDAVFPAYEEIYGRR